MSHLAKFNFKPEPNTDLNLKIKVETEQRGIVEGIVVDKYNHVICDALVKLFEVDKFDQKKLIPVSYAFTDEDGNFAFGPLCNHTEYCIKVWFNDTKVKCKTIDDFADRDCLKGQKCKEHKNDSDFETDENKCECEENIIDRLNN